MNRYNQAVSQPGKALGGKSYGRGAQKFSSTRYSAVVLDATTQTYQLFQGTRQTQGLALTNMDDASQFPSGVKFVCTHIGIRIFNENVDTDPAIVANIRKILANATLKFNLTGFQDVGLWPVSENLCVENYVSVAATGIAPIFNAPTTAAQWKALEIPIILEPRVLFNIEMQLNTAVIDANIAGTKISVLMRGIEERRGA